jgi:two-component system alkaline phosphatase synthesis response regulator PhoP
MKTLERTTETGAQTRVLLAEDEPSLALTLGDRLRAEGFAVDVAADGHAALSMALEGRYDLMVLDVMMPGRDGFDVCRTLRARQIGMPILMLTARGSVTDRVVGLKLGADDYLIKPFDTLELLARIEALLRRTNAAPGTAGRFRFGEIEVDFRRGEALRNGMAVPLSALEFKLLAYFIQHRGRLLDRDELLDRVWGYDATPVTRTVDVHVASLRQKLETEPAKPRFIETVRGRGYRFAAG